MRQKQKFGKFLGFTFNICESGWLSTNIDGHRFHKLFLLTTSLDYFQTWPNCTFSEGNYHINYLTTRGPDLEPFVVGSLIQLLCRVTKFGWLDDDIFKEAMNFLSQLIIFFIFLDFCFCFFFLSSLFFFKLIASRKYIPLSSPVAYLFSRCVRLLVQDFLYNITFWLHYYSGILSSSTSS